MVDAQNPVVIHIEMFWKKKHSFLFEVHEQWVIGVEFFVLL